MPVTISGSGTIGGISVGGLPDGAVDTDTLANNAVIFGKIGATEQGQLCRAWVNFNGTGTPAIRANFNVSSITDNGTGDYTVNFTTALVDGNYSVTTAQADQSVASQTHNRDCAILSTAAANVRVQCTYGGSSEVEADSSIVCIAIFR